jgi:16S rRNA (guanine527-N7)-methyltransferase
MNAPDRASRGSTVVLAPGICVSRETFERLQIYAVLLKKWQEKINLVSSKTLPDLWTRHFADSAQVLEVLPNAAIWADLGSGAGFPGVVMGIQIRERSEGVVHLIESDAKKCSFLREVSRETQAKTEVHHGRIEKEIPLLKVDGITARALTSLSGIVEMSRPLLQKGAFGVFLKGQDVAAELTCLTPHSRKYIKIQPSKSSSDGRIVIVEPLAGQEP